MQEEISKHTKKAFKAMKSEHSFIEKLKEIGIEISIIVFAVSLSIWLHGWSEHRHQQAEVKEFITDLKADLSADLETLKNVKKNKEKNLKEFEFSNSLTSQKLDSLEKAKKNVTLDVGIDIAKFRIGNYEGFKSSGKIAFIENKKLKKMILDYYQSYVPSIVEFDILNQGFALKILEDVSNNADKKAGILFLDKKFKSKLNFYVNYSKGYIGAYEQVIKQTEELLKEIEKSNK